MYELIASAPAGTHLISTGEMMPCLVQMMFGWPTTTGDGYKVTGEYIFRDVAGQHFVLYDWKQSAYFYKKEGELRSSFWTREHGTISLGSSGTACQSAPFIRWLEKRIMQHLESLPVGSFDEICTALRMWPDYAWSDNAARRSLQRRRFELMHEQYEAFIESKNWVQAERWGECLHQDILLGVHRLPWGRGTLEWKRFCRRFRKVQRRKAWSKREWSRFIFPRKLYQHKPHQYQTGWFLEKKCKCERCANAESV
jgi:hypothetical protein